MARKTRTQIAYKQKIKRKKRRQKLAKKGKNPNNVFFNGFYVSKTQ